MGGVTLPAVACAAWVGVRPVAGQDSTGTVRGAVAVWGSRQPLAFATIALDSGGRTVFSDSAGVFRIDRIPAGRHHLRVRDLGFSPAEIDVDVASGAPGESLQVELVRLPYRLPPVAVQGRTGCRTPGMSDETPSPALAALLGELLANGERTSLLLAQSPFDYTIEARVATRREWASRFDSEEIDTLIYASGQRHAYRPGRVLDYRFVGRRLHGGYPGPYIYLPEIEDLADSLFVVRHCFAYGGEGTVGGQRELRIDFRPLDAIRDVDVGGSFFLDPDRLMVVRSLMHLTHPDRMYPPVRQLTAEIWYREIVPLIAIEDSAHIVQTSGSALDGGPRTTVEDHRLVAIQSRRAPARH